MSDKKIFPTKYRVVSSVPNAGGENATVLEDKRKYKLTLLEEYIDSEIDHMKRKLEIMACDKVLRKELLDLLRKTLESADMPPASDPN